MIKSEKKLYMFYLKKTPWWLKKIYNSCVWQIDTKQKNIYLSFDDGPHPIATTFVLDELKKHNAKATFFCIGKNVILYPEIYKRIIAEGHAVGNHTLNHLNGWKTKNDVYVENILSAKKYIDSVLFRPPYGRITFKQLRSLSNLQQPFKVIMWSVLSGDFDIGISNIKCLNNVINNACSGSIVVFHDSEKALEKIRFTLPKILDYFINQQFEFKRIDA